MKQSRADLMIGRYTAPTAHLLSSETLMCRNIRPLFNYEPPATQEEIRASSLQYVRKVSGYTKPSQANEVAFNEAVESVAEVTTGLIATLVTNAPKRNREAEAEKARARARERYG